MIVYTETDTDNTATMTIGPFATSITDLRKQMSEGGTAGSSEVTVSLPASLNGNLTSSAHFRTAAGVPNANFASGNWTVRFEVTSSNMNITWDAIGIAGVNAAVTGASIVYQVTGLAISCATTGVKSHTGAGAAITTNTDHIQISLGFSNGDTMMTQTLGITPSQNVDSPLEPPAASRYGFVNFQDPGVFMRRLRSGIVVPRLWLPAPAPSPHTLSHVI